MIPKSDITALILAGGRGRRVHGQDKGLMHYQGRALIAWVLERLAPQVGLVLISANRHLDQYQAYGWPVITDTLADYQGPLAGLCQGLEYANTRWMMTVPCDGPLLPLDLAQRLAGALEPERASVALAHDGKQAQFAHALMARSLLGDLRSYLASGERSLGGWLRRHRPIMADFSDIPLAFSNLNHLKDFCAPAAVAEAADGFSVGSHKP
ncbi:molybdenum cofactor guanylyltransferase MobA [Thiorhodovibrio frisius]|uniref:Molybdenum cofactor guanylyltransferase n=1 Tax=Thiorhodovibrio frisius TaxID=631362 RepID=H8Z1G4_9GAMM|nr:molybdenum cofactor guanylyltransferase MobA [Thiorhodovibrio frisius]EIC22513.1 molybdopterin-guanine dinucleotide biosynthesis protein A, proteobacterial [Thiorhodovibrio frisius]